MKLKEVQATVEFPFYVDVPLGHFYNNERSLVDDEKLRLAASALAQEIKNRCGPWLKESNGYPALRAIDKHPRISFGTEDGKDYYLGAFIKPIREDRRPLDSSNISHGLGNAILRYKGLKANRSNSAFVVGKNYRLNDLKRYGRTFVFLPIGNFNYSWNKYINDWTTDTGTIKETLYSMLPEYKDILDRLAELEDILETDAMDWRTRYEEMNRLRVRLATLRRAKFGPNSIEMKTAAENIAKSDNPIIEKLFHGFQGDDGSLPTALKSKAEILVSANEAMYVDLHFYSHWVAKELGFMI